ERSAGAGWLHPHRIPQRLRQPGSVPGEPAGKTVPHPTDLGSRLGDSGRGAVLPLQGRPHSEVVQEGQEPRWDFSGSSPALANRPKAGTGPRVLPWHSVRPATLVCPCPDPPIGGRVRVHHGFAAGKDLLPKPRRE